MRRQCLAFLRQPELSAPVGGRASGLRSEGSWLAAELLRAGLEPGVLDRCAGWLGLSPAHAQGAPLASKGPACLSPPLGRVRYVLVWCAEGTGATIQPFRFCPLFSLPARPMPEALLSRGGRLGGEWCVLVLHPYLFRSNWTPTVLPSRVTCHLRTTRGRGGTCGQGRRGLYSPGCAPARPACAAARARTTTLPVPRASSGHPLPHSITTHSLCVPGIVQVSTRAFERGAVRLLGACFLLRNAFKKPKFSSGAPPRTP